MEPLSAEREAELNQMVREQWAKEAPMIADYFTKHELRLIANCAEYRDGDPAGLPGHNLMLLVAKMANYYCWLEGERLDELIEMAKDNRPTH